MGTPSSTHTRMTSWRSRPISFDSSSGVRWFAIGLPPLRTKKPAGATPDGLEKPSGTAVAGNQRARLPEERMAEEYPAGVTAAKHPLAGFEERRVSVKGVDVRYFVAGAGDPPVVSSTASRERPPTGSRSQPASPGAIASSCPTCPATE